MSDLYAVIGNPVAHSLSPRIHGLFAAQCGAAMRYVALLAPLDGFAATVEGFVRNGGRGLNVTLPFKQQAFKLTTQATPRARAAAAVNTLSFEGSTVLGDNTDGAGLVRDLRVNLQSGIAGRRVLLLGAGGAARGVIAPLCSEQPASLCIANRSADKARQLAGEFSRPEMPIRGCGSAELAGERYDLLINATSAGLSGAALDLPPELFAPGCTAYDMVYGRPTAFLRQARAAGAALTADGLGMLVEQAAEAFLLWRGRRPETAPVLSLLRAELEQRGDGN